MKGDEDRFIAWQSGNKEKWTSFIKWFGDNKISVDAANKFYRGMY